MPDDENEYRFVRKRKRRDTDRQTPRALAAGSASHGRGLPEGVASALTELARLKPREPAEMTAFGAHVIRVEGRDGVVTLILPDGTRISGSVDDAHRLALLLSNMGRER